MGKFKEIFEEDYKYLERGSSDEELGRFSLDRPFSPYSSVEHEFLSTILREEIEHTARKKRRNLLARIFKVASQILTDRQLQIFIMKFSFNLRSVDIAHRLKFSEAYVSMVLKICLTKIKKKLNHSY